MREIKFRAWEKTSESMVYDVQNVSRKRIIGESACESFQEVLDSWEYEIMQYTGIKDKNGKTYCQDDLIKYKNRIHRLIKGAYMFELAGFYEAYQDNPTDFFAEGAYREGEIIGNIYENPELLEEITK